MKTPLTYARLVATLLVIGSLAVPIAPVRAAQRPVGAAGSPVRHSSIAGAHVPREIVVRYRSGMPLMLRSMARFAVTATLQRRLPLRGAELVKVAQGTDLGSAIEVLSQRPEVIYAEPNYIYRSAVTPNDPLSEEEWGLNDPVRNKDIDAPEAWDVTTGSKDVIVAVADTGVAYEHPDLIDNMWTNPGEYGSGKQSNGIDDDHNGYVDDWRGWDWVGNDNNPADLIGHGTHVAGTIGASGDNLTGIAGVNWNVSIMPLRILELDGTGTAADLASAFLYARRKGAQVVNASLGGPRYSRAMADAIGGSAKTLFVVAAGNEGHDLNAKRSYPCNFSNANVLCVAATNERGRLTGWSNYGRTVVDVAAPGTNILSTAPHVTTVFTEDFESTPGARWVSGGTRDMWGSKRDGYGAYMTDSPSSRYANATNSWLASRAAIHLPVATACGLEFQLRMDTEPGQDGVIVETSRDGKRWSLVSGYSGKSRGWQMVKTDLATGHDVWVRFRMISDRTIRGDGVRIDNVRVRCSTSDFETSDYRDLSGTSMASPHASGVAALLWSIAPNVTPADVAHALIAGSTDSPGLAGKVRSGGRLNALGALTVLADELQLPGPTPTPADPTPTPTPTPTSTPTPTAASPGMSLL